MVLVERLIYMEIPRESFRKSGLERGLVLGERFIYMEMPRESFRKSGLERGLVSGERFIYMEIPGESFGKSGLERGLVSGLWSFTRGSTVVTFVWWTCVCLCFLLQVISQKTL